MQYFKTAAECENLSRAAEKLYISQPALTKVIQRLEQDLGTPLFERQGKSVRLNRAGKIVLLYANEVCQTIESMRALVSLEGKQAEEGLHIFTDLPNISRYLIPAFQMEHDYPKLLPYYDRRLHSPGELLKKGICQAVITCEAVQDPAVRCVHLFRDRMLLNVPAGSPLCRKGRVDYRDLTGLKILQIQTLQDTRSQQIIRRNLERSGCRPEFVQTMDIGSQQYLVENTEDCTISSELTSLFWRHPKRVGLPFAAPDAVIDYYLLCPQEPTEELNILLSWLTQWFSWAEQMCRSRFA